MEPPMLQPLPSPPDAMPLREALRGLRHLLRRGGQSLRETVQPMTLPAPAARLAERMLREVEQIARGVDEAASGLAKQVLVQPGPPAPTLQTMMRDSDGEAAFGSAGYAALRAVLDQLAAPEVFVSEASARLAYRRVAGVQGLTDVAACAAALTMALLDVRVVRDASAVDVARVPGAALAPVAVFAVLLWLQSERPEDEDEAALASAADLSVALCREVVAACRAGDVIALAALYAKWSAHV